MNFTHIVISSFNSFLFGLFFEKVLFLLNKEQMNSFDIWDDFADLSTICQNELNVTYKIRKRENAQVVNNKYIIGLFVFV